MIAMLWLYLCSNGIIELEDPIIVFLSIFYIAVDGALFYALYSRVRKK